MKRLLNVFFDLSNLLQMQNDQRMVDIVMWQLSVLA